MGRRFLDSVNEMRYCFNTVKRKEEGSRGVISLNTDAASAMQQQQARTK